MDRTNGEDKFKMTGCRTSTWIFDILENRGILGESQPTKLIGLWNGKVSSMIRASWMAANVQFLDNGLRVIRACL